jgi:hypothetical protein
MRSQLMLLILICLVSLLLCPTIYAQETKPQQIHINQKIYPFYPELLQEPPEIPSPFTTEDGEEIVIAITKVGKYMLIPVTIENGEPSDYDQPKRGKGRELELDTIDFPTLARTELHSEIELDQIKTITGRSISEITAIARPGQYSSAGFISQHEDIISVLKGDNRLVKRMGLTHQQIVKPLFHVWNLVLAGIHQGKWTDEAMNIKSILYHGREINLKFSGKGFQESIFNDEILGEYHLEMWRELDQNERALLIEKYASLSKVELADLLNKLSHIHTGEMVPYYAIWYGFYEGHTDFRADPIAIAFIFGLRSAKDIENTFAGDLYKILNQHFTANYISGETEK